MRYLRFLSLQGISRITELPKSIRKLRNLTILDIRACLNLEKIPDDIGCLVNLTHLDMSECVLLDELPKGISLLTKLEVLSGFIVVESNNKNTCTLHDLKGFDHLRKLSIHTGLDVFPSKHDLRALNQFKALRKLTIEWGRGSSNAKSQHNFVKTKTLLKRPERKQYMEVSSKLKRSPNLLGGPPNNGFLKGLLGRGVKHLPTIKSMIRRAEPLLPELPSHLIKLNLQCLPQRPLDWLRPEKLPDLKILYIRGGHISDLGQFQDAYDSFGKIRWNNVEELKLKYLKELEIEWRELLELFLKLEYLEKVHCPKLCFFPCDEIGVWTNKKIVT